MLDRRKQPEFKNIEKIDIIKAEQLKFDNNISLYTINAGSEDLIKIELIFDAGIWSNPKPLIASTTNSLIGEGTKKLSSAKISEQLDFYGSYLNHNVDKDTASISLYSLGKYLPKTIKILEDVIKNATFPEKELSIYLQNKKQSFIVDSEMVSTLSARKFQTILYGEDHPYGSNLTLDDFKNVDRKQLIEHYKRLYNANKCKIIVSGNVTENVIELIREHFGGNDWNIDQKGEDFLNYSIKTATENQFIVEKENAVQSAVRIGKVMVNKQHEDYIGLQVLNTIFGGYFGSRLMGNIREDKGYTYGIGSAIISMKHSGYFTIVTEVGANVTKSAIQEIYFEMDRLRNELVNEDELSSVKSYKLGELLKAFDGPFALADTFRGILEYGLDYDYFDRYINIVKNISPKDINQLANRYFIKEDMKEVIAGKY